MYRFPGPVTMWTATARLNECLAAIDRGEAELGLDALAHSDSSALSVLMAALRHARAKGVALRVTGMPAGLASLASLYGVDGLLRGD